MGSAFYIILKGDVMSVVNIEDTFVEMTELVLPSHSNNHGTAFGGQIAAWCDIAGAVSAQRFCRSPVVTVSMDQLHFLEPVRKGMVVILRAKVNQAWNTSMEIGVRVEAEDPLSGNTVHCCSAYLTFVALDSFGRPKKIPTLNLSDRPEYQRQAQDALIRKENRLRVKEERKRKHDGQL